jgi:predicted RNase H-related nuclease YkuK (DUF458 family)
MSKKKKKGFKVKKADRVPLSEQPKPYYSETYGKDNIANKYGRLSEDDAMWIAAERIRTSPSDFTIYIGTDSQTHSETKIVNVFVIYEHKKGGFSFFTIDWTSRYSLAKLREKIADETQRSIDLANKVANFMLENDVDVEVCVHADVGKGKHSKTTDMIQWVVAMIEGAGFPAEVKPMSWAASSVADRISK